MALSPQNSAGGLRQCVTLELHQIRDEQEQSAHPCDELAWAEHEVADIGDRLSIGTDADGTLLVEPARQWRKAFCGEHLAHRGGAQRGTLLLERLADLVDRIVALAQGYDLVMRAALLGLVVRRVAAKNSGRSPRRKAWHSTRNAPAV
jgi:hypothetical protein